MVFVDLEKTYKNVPREVFWWAITKKGISKKYIKILIKILNQK